MRHKWLEENIIDTFNIYRDGIKFDISIHPQDPQEDMSHIVVDLPSVSLVVRCMGYIKGIYLKAALTKKEIKAIAQEIVERINFDGFLREKENAD